MTFGTCDRGRDFIKKGLQRISRYTRYGLLIKEEEYLPYVGKISSWGLSQIIVWNASIDAYRILRNKAHIFCCFFGLLKTSGTRMPLRKAIRTHITLCGTLPLIFAAQSSRVSIRDCKTSSVPLAAILEIVVVRSDA